MYAYFFYFFFSKINNLNKSAKIYFLFFTIMNIILIGYMGSGKTTLGKKLASRLRLQFIDTDRIIEHEENCSIAEIFSKHGENHFRELEKRLVLQLKEKDNLLISTGGGMPCFNNVMDDLNESGTTIYLKRTAKELVNRILNSKKKRPLTEGKSENELIQFIENALKEREVFYEKAHIIADRNVQNITSLELMVKTYLRMK